MTYDLSPLFRTAIGFDRLLRQMDAVKVTAPTYPPYDIERTGDDAYRLTMAVAGFGPDDVELTIKDNTLVIVGRVPAQADKGEVLHRGIAGRAFERRFALAEHIVVQGAELKDGLLQVSMQRVVPEALKPRRIAIGGAQPQAIANDAGVASLQAA